MTNVQPRRKKAAFRIRLLTKKGRLIVKVNLSDRKRAAP